MSYIGDYQLATVKQLKADGSGFEQVAISDIDMNSASAQTILGMKDAILSITEAGEMITHMPIPEGAPAEEIAKAEAAGRIWNGNVIVDKKTLKFENDNVYLQDPSKFITGEEWVKINSDTEGELDMVTMTYKKIK